MTSRSHNYVSKAGGEKILKYKYSGSDDSILYNYVISPLAQWIVDNIMPESIAPNLITVFGLSLVASAHVAMACYNPDMDQEVPSWVYAWSAISLCVYQILDVCDGKQARKTGNASPLGLLFDHGCDALNTVISACTIASAMLMGSTYMSVAILLFPAMVFFMATFEEYYTGTLALPIINGPNEGLAVMYFIYTGCAIFGPGFWAEPSFIAPSIPNNLLFVIGTGIGAVYFTLSNLMTVFSTVSKKGGSVLSPLVGLIPFVILVVLSVSWIALSPNDIVKTHVRMLMWTLGLLFCKLVMHMMLAHLCHEPLQLLRKTLIAMFLFASIAVAGLVPNVSEIVVVCVFFALALMSYSHMVYYVIMELSTVLGIRCFVVKPKKK